MPYEIVVHELAVEELAALRPFDQRRIVAEIREQLSHHPRVPSRRRKCLVDLTPAFEHEVPVWELRVGDFRIFYDVQYRRATRSCSCRTSQGTIAEDGGYRVKNIATNELKANLDAVLNSAQGERIVISRDGKPCAVLVGIEDYDAEDLRLAGSQDFWQMIASRRTRGKSIPLSEVEAQLASTSRKPASKQAAPKKAKKRS